MEPPPHQKRKSHSWAREIKVPQVPGSLPEWLEIPRFVEPGQQITAPSASSPSLAPQSSCLPSGKAKKSWRGIRADSNKSGRRVCSYLQEYDRVPEWWRELWSLLCSMDELLDDIQLQGLAHQQATAFRLPATQQEKDGLWTAPPCLGLLGHKVYLPQKDFKECKIIEMCSMKKLWHQLWPSEVHCLLQNAPRNALQSSTRAPQMPHPPAWEWWPGWHQDVICG